jgi:hypothetical protein
MATKSAQQPLGATDSGHRPGDYALGSIESRAAARAAVEQRRASQKRRELVIISDISLPNRENDPEFDPMGPIVHDWHMADDGVLERICWISPGMTVEEAERICAEQKARKAGYHADLARKAITSTERSYGSGKYREPSNTGYPPHPETEEGEGW